MTVLNEPFTPVGDALAEEGDSGGEETAALKEALSSPSEEAIPALRLGRALRHACRAADAEHRRLAQVWREPLITFGGAAATRAATAGVQEWALAAAQRAAQLTALLSVLQERAESYQEQLRVARRSQQQVARAPLLQVIARLDSLAEELRGLIPSLGVARVAFDAQMSKVASIPMATTEPVATANEEVPPERILQTRNLTHHVVSGLLEAAVDVLHAVARAAGLAPVLAPATAASAPGQPSTWLLVLEAATDARQRSRHLLGDVPCFEPLVRPPRITTGYWRFRGLGAPIRMICTYTGVDWKDIKYEAKARARGGWTAREWEREDKRKLMKQNPLMQLPYVVNHTTGEVVTQSSAVCLYLGRLLGLNGSGQSAKSANEQVMLYIHAMWMEMRDLVYPSKRTPDVPAFREALRVHVNTTLPEHYEKLESWLGQRSTGYFAGWAPCVADFHVWEMLDQEEALATAHGYRSPLADFELLETFHARIRALPRLQDYFEGEDAHLPINNKMAFFK